MEKDKNNNSEQNDKTSYDFFISFLNKQREENIQEKDTSKANLNKSEEGKKQRFYNLLNSIFQSINHVMDVILMDSRKSKWLSLVVAILVFLMTTGANSTTDTSTTGRVVSDVEIEMLNLNDKYVVADKPGVANIMLVGNPISIQTTMLQKKFHLYADLNGLEEGTHSVDLKVEGIAKNITASAVPSKVSITLSPKESRVFALGYRYINEDKKDAKYVLEKPVLSKSEVSVTGGKSVLDKIKYVDALIDVKGINGSFNQNAKIVAYDNDGKELDVNIEPNTVDVSVNVTSFSKSVPINVTQVGKMQPYLAISSCTLNEASVTLYGDEKELQDINFVTANLDVSDIKESTTIHGVNIEYPPNIRGNLTKVNVTVTVEKKMVKKLDKIPIKIENDGGKKVSFLQNTGFVNVEVSGAVSKISNITPDAIIAIVDLSNLDSGDHNVKVSVKSQDSLISVKLLSSEEARVRIE